MQVRPHLFASLASLPSALTSLGVFGDSWDALQLSKAELDPLARLTALQHLGLHHYEISGSAESFSSGSSCIPPGLYSWAVSHHTRIASKVGDLAAFQSVESKQMETVSCSDMARLP